MKQLITSVAVFCALAMFASAQDAGKANPSAATPTKQAKLICPVTGEDADPEVSYAYDGTTYYFCCQGCVGKFKKDPGKYIKASASEKFDPCDHAEQAKDGHGHSESGSGDVSATAEESAAPVINTGKDLSAKIANTVCPVMNEPVDKSVTTVTYKGTVYGFCCKSCIKKFAKDPEKYLKKT